MSDIKDRILTGCRFACKNLETHFCDKFQTLSHSVMSSNMAQAEHQRQYIRIKLTDNRPIRIRQYNLPLHYKAEIKKKKKKKRIGGVI